MWQQAQNWFKRLTGQTAPDPLEPGIGQPTEEQLNPCCNQPIVHIAYRGKSDDRLYMAYNRKWEEVRYFQKDGLRAFCSVCRRRLL